MLTFHVTLHAKPPSELASAVVEIAGQGYRTWPLDAGQASWPFDVSFEDSLAKLARFERLFIEPDGSFVWTSPDDNPRWQLDGVLFDSAEHVQYVELKGRCPVAQLEQLLNVFVTRAEAVLFQVVRAGVFLDDDEFRRYASRSSCD